MAPLPPGATPDLLQCEAWKPLDWLVHGFSQRTGGRSKAYGVDELNLGFTVEDVPETVLHNRERLLEMLMTGQPSTGQSRTGQPSTGQPGRSRPEIVTLSQIHSAMVHRVKDGQPVEPGDGMMTDQAGKLLAILTADCVPVLVVDTRKRVVAGFHAGWRGTVQGIVQSGVVKMQAEFGSQTGDLSAAIGPCIGACCYTVGEEVQKAFRARYPYVDALFSGTGEAGQALRLDLVAANRRQLLDAGLSDESIHAPGLCTGCYPERFFSHRKSGGRTGRMMSVVGISQGA